MQNRTSGRVRRHTVKRLIGALAVVAALVAIPGTAAAQGQGQGNNAGGNAAANSQAGNNNAGGNAAASSQAGNNNAGGNAAANSQAGTNNAGGNNNNNAGGNNNNQAANPTARPSNQRGIEKRVLTVDGRAATADGRGSNAAPVVAGQNVTYQIVVTGTPPGNSGRGEVVDNIPQFFSFVSSSPSAEVDARENKATFRNVEFSATGSVTLTITLRAGDTGANKPPCNHVATNVAHVNGMGSDQAQVRVICPEAPTATRTPVPAAAAAVNTPVPTVVATTVPLSLGVSKTLEDAGRTVTQINNGDLGKRMRYNILLTRKGNVPGRTEMAFTDLIREGCIADGSGLITPIAAEIDRNDLGINDDFSVQINGCTITGRVSGDNKGNLDPTAPGNQFHVHITVQVAQPGSTAVVTNVPRQVTNEVRANVVSGPGAPCCEETFTLNTAVNLPAGGQPTAVPTAVPTVAAQVAATGSATTGSTPASAVTLPAAASAQLAGPVEVGGVTLAPGSAIRIVALPPGALVQAPAGGGPAVVPPGSVLGVVDRPQLGLITTQTPVFVDVLDQAALRAPAPGPLPQTGFGPAPALLPQTGGAGAAGGGFGPILPMLAGASLVVAAAFTRLRRR